MTIGGCVGLFSLEIENRWRHVTDGDGGNILNGRIENRPSAP